MTAQEFKEFRLKLGLTQVQLGRALGFAEPGRNIHFFEKGREIKGPLAVALRYIARHGLDATAKRDAGLKS